MSRGKSPAQGHFQSGAAAGRERSDREQGEREGGSFITALRMQQEKGVGEGGRKGES